MPDVFVTRKWHLYGVRQVTCLEDVDAKYKGIITVMLNGAPRVLRATEWHHTLQQAQEYVRKQGAVTIRRLERRIATMKLVYACTAKLEPTAAIAPEGYVPRIPHSHVRLLCVILALTQDAPNAYVRDILKATNNSTCTFYSHIDELITKGYVERVGPARYILTLSGTRIAESAT